jgi:uncharacterized damage-inducible protein DinB
MNEVQVYIAGWLSHRKALQQLVDRFTDEHLTYKPWENGMSLSELVLHIVNSTLMFTQIVKDGEHKPGDRIQNVASANELQTIVKQVTDATLANLESLTSAELEREVTFASMKMSGRAMLEMAKEHEIHHKGQVFTYARLVGLDNLPFFISR